MCCPPSSIYIHIPFCVRKCAYCDFTSYPGAEHLFGGYVDALRKEIELASGHFIGSHISTIYFGGGTPNVLSADQLTAVLGEVKCRFDVDHSAEITTEANPGVRANVASTHTLTLSHSQTFDPLRHAGFNRLSLGVQSLHDNELRRLGRLHTAGQAIQAFNTAREAGFTNISIDLMYGIPEQTCASWQQTLDHALGLRPEHISLYSLTVEEGTPFYAMRQAGKLELPGDDIEADMYETAIRTLTSAGYVHYEISNFAKPGFECLHNLTYWRNDPYFGFGVGAASYLNGVRAVNVAGLDAYISRVRLGESVVGFEERLTDRESMGETMFLGLRMMRGVDVGSFERRYGVPPATVFAAEIADLTARGLIEVGKDHIRLTHTGLFLANDVFSEFVA